MRIVALGSWALRVRGWVCEDGGGGRPRQWAAARPRVGRPSRRRFHGPCPPPSVEYKPTQALTTPLTPARALLSPRPNDAERAEQVASTSSRTSRRMASSRRRAGRRRCRPPSRRPRRRRRSICSSGSSACSDVPALASALAACPPLHKPTRLPARDPMAEPEPEPEPDPPRGEPRACEESALAGPRAPLAKGVERTRPTA